MKKEESVARFIMIIVTCLHLPSNAIRSPHHRCLKRIFLLLLSHPLWCFYQTFYFYPDLKPHNTWILFTLSLKNEKKISFILTHIIALSRTFNSFMYIFLAKETAFRIVPIGCSWMISAFACLKSHSFAFIFWKTFSLYIQFLVNSCFFLKKLFSTLKALFYGLLGCVISDEKCSLNLFHPPQCVVGFLLLFLLLLLLRFILCRLFSELLI